MIKRVKFNPNRAELVIQMTWYAQNYLKLKMVWSNGPKWDGYPRETNLLDGFLAYNIQTIHNEAYAFDSEKYIVSNLDQMSNVTGTKDMNNISMSNEKKKTEREREGRTKKLLALVPFQDVLKAYEFPPPISSVPNMHYLLPVSLQLAHLLIVVQASRLLLSILTPPVDHYQRFKIGKLIYAVQSRKEEF